MNAYVLVGGRSSRMGRSKADLFLERIVAAARPVFDEVIAVDRWRTGNPGCPDRQDCLSSTIFEEPHEGEGAVFGIVRALRDAQAKAFILAVDYPLITEDVLRYLRDREGTPIWNGHPQSLCAVWSAEMLPVLQQRIAEKRFDLRTIGGREMIPESELRARFSGEPLMNVNTAEEWERAQRFLASR
ncbi:MAG TPA: molybdenum cofactor guanylyltransferase [Thermoanaerobaculia bacterium]|nr:molybdenum cofactor guanylyltransferase [Thermoanaerobaculia bacterium]